jgi:rRNA-processing protein FCF1
MGGHAVIIVDTNVLVNLATPVVDPRDSAPSGEDPLKAVLTTYDVHVPSAVLGELTHYEAEAPPSRSAGLPMLNRKHKRVGWGY